MADDRSKLMSVETTLAPKTKKNRDVEQMFTIQVDNCAVGADCVCRGVYLGITLYEEHDLGGGREGLELSRLDPS